MTTTVKAPVRHRESLSNANLLMSISIGIFFVMYISAMLIWGGVKCLTIAPIYALIVYIVSLIIRIAQKPRI